MSTRAILSIVLNIAAVVVPVAALVLRFGVDTTFNLQDSSVATEQLLAVGGAVLAGFVIAVFASRLLVNERGYLFSLMFTTIRELRESKQ